MCRYKATKAISDDVQIVVAKEIRCCMIETNRECLNEDVLKLIPL